MSVVLIAGRGYWSVAVLWLRYQVLTPNVQGVAHFFLASAQSFSAPVVPVGIHQLCASLAMNAHQRSTRTPVLQCCHHS